MPSESLQPYSNERSTVLAFLPIQATHFVGGSEYLPEDKFYPKFSKCHQLSACRCEIQDSVFTRTFLGCLNEADVGNTRGDLFEVPSGEWM